MLLAAVLAWLGPLSGGVLYTAVKATVIKENVLMVIV